MMRKLSLLVASLAMAACAAHVAPQQLVDARTAYAQAAGSKAATLVPAELHVAHEYLGKAEQEFADHPGSQDVIDAAYVAMRKAQRAEVLANIAAETDLAAMAERQKSQVADTIISAQAAKLRDKDADLKDDQTALAQQRQLTEQEHQARVAAEKKAADAMDALSKSLEVKSDTRGTVITLSGGVLFATNQAVILPGAQRQLDQVADALKVQAEHHFVVEGHTDNQGTNDINDALSQHRADAVRDYLIVHGVSADAISAKGFGSSRPIADNKTAEGRAMNRRVEIIVDKGNVAIK
jgi:outer membrane protein OmpA-like peptidoglycan-associated protein